MAGLPPIPWRRAGVVIAMAAAFAVMGAVFALASRGGAVAEAVVEVEGGPEPPPMAIVLAAARSAPAAAAGLAALEERPKEERTALDAALPGPWACLGRVIRKLSANGRSRKPVEAFQERTQVGLGPKGRTLHVLACGPDVPAAKILAGAAALGIERFLTTPRSSPEGKRPPQRASVDLSRKGRLSGQIRLLEAYLSSPTGAPPADVESKEMKEATRRLNALLEERARLSIDFGPKHPEVRENEARIQQTRVRIEALAQALLHAGRAELASWGTGTEAHSTGSPSAPLSLARALGVARLSVAQPIRAWRKLVSVDDAGFVGFCGLIGLVLGLIVTVSTGRAGGGAHARAQDPSPETGET